MNEDKPTATQHQQNGHALVFHCPPSTPAANHSSQSWARPCQPFTLGAGPIGFFIDADLNMRTQVQWTVASCFATLRQLRSIRWSVPAPVYQSLVVALVLSRLDYGNITLIGIPAYQLRRLQSVMNAAARSITGLRRSDHITDMLASLTDCVLLSASICSTN